MDNTYLTMEEYIELEAEKARSYGRAFNWETTTYDKVSYFDDFDYLKDFENEFPAIVYDDALTSGPEISFEPTYKMDNPYLTMEEYIELEAEKACRYGRAFNWETTTYDKVSYFDDFDYLKDFENEFPAIVYDDALRSGPEISFEPTVRPLYDDQIDFIISFDEFDDEDYIVMYDKDSFSYKLIFVNYFKMNSVNGIDEVDLPHNDVVIEQLGNDINYNVNTQSYELEEDIETNHDIYPEPSDMGEYLIIIEVVIQMHFHEEMPLIFIIKNQYVSFSIPFDPKRFYKDDGYAIGLRRSSYIFFTLLI
nr:hypothetical protein [Tanacetum cinerariifolium]